MSKNVALFIDVANIYYAARGQDVDVDYIALLKHATKGRDLIRAYAYSGLDPENENQRKFLDFLSKNGYKVVHKDIRKFGDGRVKANLDIELVVDLFRLQDRMDIAVIVSGDGDFASAIRALQDVGVRCEVISFRPNTSSDLIAVADEFTDIMKIIGIGRAKSERGMSMPEMPAKEVNPEFGFREASRGVAAAALAALREGEKPARSPRRRTTRTAVAEAVPADGEAVATIEAAPRPAAPLGAAASGEAEHEGGEGDGTRRRRRRRGGRGRGRGRHTPGSAAAIDGDEAAAPGEPGEVTWQEFDDISQLGELTDLGEPGEERGYSFEEADAETLAALGLEADAAAGPQPSEGSAPAAPARGRGGRSGRGRARAAAKPAEAASAHPDASPEGSTAAMAPEAAGEHAEVHPAPRARRRSRASESASPEAPQAEPPSPTAGEDSPPTATRARTRSRRTAAASNGEPGEAVVSDTSDVPAAPAKTARTRRTRSTAASPAGSESQPAGEAGADEGIWQRFRSARGGSRRTS